jgi:hypothetical protein
VPFDIKKGASLHILVPMQDSVKQRRKIYSKSQNKKFANFEFCYMLRSYLHILKYEKQLTKDLGISFSC